MKVLPNEKETVRRLTQDDKEAFCELYAAYREAVIRFARRMLRSGELAEDVFQDTFAVVWQSRRFIDPETAFAAWLFTVVRNRVLNLLREEANREVVKSAILSGGEEDNNTRDTILLNDLIARIEKAKGTLTPKQREAYTLSREENLSHGEIADRLQISPNTVREHITMALKQIRLYIKKS